MAVAGVPDFGLNIRFLPLELGDASPRIGLRAFGQLAK